MEDWNRNIKSQDSMVSVVIRLCSAQSGIRTPAGGRNLFLLHND